jgi:uncharacterized protein YraI
MQLKLAPLLAAAILAVSAGTAVATPGFSTDVANVRTGPGIGFPIAATLPPQAPLNVGPCVAGWCRVIFPGGVGFMASPLVALGVPAPVGPAVAAAGPLDAALGLVTAPFRAVGSAFGAAAPEPALAPPPAPAPVVAAY